MTLTPKCFVDGPDVERAGDDDGDDGAEHHQRLENVLNVGKFDIHNRTSSYLLCSY